MAKNSLLRDLNFVSAIIHESKIKRPPPRFLTSREPHQCRSLVSKTKKTKIFNRGVKVFERFFKSAEIT